MCNYCFNSIRAMGNKTAIKHLHKAITDLLKSKNAGVYELLAAHNYTEKELESVYRRDYISYCEREIDFDTIHKQYYFDFYTESAWAPNLEMLFKLVKDKYMGQIKLIYISEEPGNEIYQTNDEFNAVWADKYYMEYSLKNDVGGEYFTDKKEIVRYVKRNFDVEVRTDETLEDIQRKVLQKHHIKRQGDHYFYIHEFEFDNNQYENVA